MKKLLAIFIISVSVAFFTSCSNTKESEATSSDSLSTTNGAVETSSSTASPGYFDPETGGAVTRDVNTGLYVNDAGTPVEFYVDATTLDTFYGKTGQNVNNAIIHKDNDLSLDETKIKVDEDDIKIEHADGSKTKIEGDKIKVKDANGKAKMDGDETKVKDGEGKLKSDAEGTKTK